MENKIILKITLPICEVETYKLFKATPVPIIADKVCLIANLENNYFMINEEKTEYTELTSTEVYNGIRVDDNNVLYRVSTLTKTNPKSNCVWSQFLDNDINLLTTICNLSPILRSNYITIINNNDIFHVTVVKPLIAWQNCGEKERKYLIDTTGFLQSKPNCFIKTNEFIIKNNDNIKLNFSTSVLPFQFGGSFSISEFENITSILPELDNKSLTTIIDSKSTIATLRTETEGLIKSAIVKIDLKKLTHEQSYGSLFHFSYRSGFI